MTTPENEPQTLVALFDTLAAATDALYALQDAGVPYANITMESHDGADVASSVGAAVPYDQVWSLSVFVGEPLHTKALDVLHQQHAFTVGQQPAEHGGRDEVDRGRAAWGHYVFEPVAVTDRVGEAAGTTGTTGITSSGAFADKANAEDKPSTDNVTDQARG